MINVLALAVALVAAQPTYSTNGSFAVSQADKIVEKANLGDLWFLEVHELPTVLANMRSYGSGPKVTKADRDSIASDYQRDCKKAEKCVQSLLSSDIFASPLEIVAQDTSLELMDDGGVQILATFYPRNSLDRDFRTDDEKSMQEKVKKRIEATRINARKQRERANGYRRAVRRYGLWSPNRYRNPANRTAQLANRAASSEVSKTITENVQQRREYFESVDLVFAIPASDVEAFDIGKMASAKSIKLFVAVDACALKPPDLEAGIPVVIGELRGRIVDTEKRYRLAARRTGSND